MSKSGSQHTPTADNKGAGARSRHNRHAADSQALVESRFSGRRTNVSFSSSIPNRIWEYGAGKAQRSMLHDVVHEFRREHGFNDKYWPNYTKTYAAALIHYLGLEPPCEHAAAISKMGSANGYRLIRQAGRMRQSMPELEGEVLRAYAREVRAALIWRAVAEEVAQKAIRDTA